MPRSRQLVLNINHGLALGFNEPEHANMIKKRFILAAILLCSIPSTICMAQTDYFSPANILAFAEYLHQEQDYLRAAGEYRRYLSTTGPTGMKDDILYRIGGCYLSADRVELSRDAYRRILSEYPHSAFSEKAHYRIAESFFIAQDYSASAEYIENTISSVTSRGCISRMNQLLGVNYLYQKRWDTAHRHFSSLLDSRGFCAGDSVFSLLDTYAVKGMHISKKSALGAGIMSALIPGTGKMYGGRFRDGVHSLLLIALTAWQAYDGFHDTGAQSVKGWMYGTLGSILYFGNIYGSAVQVNIYNRQVEDDIIHSIDIDITWR